MHHASPTPPIDRLLLALAAQNAEHGTLLLDLEHRIFWASPTAERILGADPGALHGRQLATLFTDEERGLGIPEVEVAIARAGSPSEDDRWQQRMDGSRFWASGALVPLYDDAGTLAGFGKTFRNRTDLRLQFQTLRNRLAASQAAAQRREAFLLTLAHELRNPLAPMTTTCHVLRTLDGDPRLQQAADLLERQIRTMARLIDDMLDTSLAGPTDLSLHLAPVAINGLLRDAAEAVRAQAQARGQSMDVIAPDEPLVVDADPDRLRQVFSNLLANAVKFTPDGGRLWVKLTKEGNECVARVEDTGMGLAPEQHARVFELFARAEPEPLPAGQGVGLALVKTLVERHGGTVQVESDGAGKGAKFTVRLPLHETQ